MKNLQYSNVLAFDPSLNNWGWVLFTDEKPAESGVISVVPDDTIKTKSVKEMFRTASLFQELQSIVTKAPIAYVELPTGGRGTATAFSYVACVTLVGVLKTLGLQVIPIGPMDNKKTIGKKDASKLEVINWVENLYPNFLPRKRDGSILLGKAEHIADAILTYHTGKRLMKVQSIVQLEAHELNEAIAEYIVNNGLAESVDEVEVNTSDVDMESISIAVGGATAPAKAKPKTTRKKGTVKPTEATQVADGGIASESLQKATSEAENTIPDPVTTEPEQVVIEEAPASVFAQSAVQEPTAEEAAALFGDSTPVANVPEQAAVPMGEPEVVTQAPPSLFS